MISKNLKRIAADSNVLLSAIIGKAALKIFTQTRLEIVTTEFNIKEIQLYLPYLADKYHLDAVALWMQFKMLPCEIKSTDYYHDKIALAEKYLRDRDPNDVDLAALALKEEIPLWSNDLDFTVLPIEVYPTAKLLTVFNL